MFCSRGINPAALRAPALPAGLLLAAVASACTPAVDDGPVDNFPEDPGEPAADEALAFTTPVWQVPSGEERMFCWAVDWTPQQDYLVTGFRPFQGAGGHHLVAMKSVSAVQPGAEWDCTDPAMMSSLEPLVITDDDEQTALDEGFAFRVEAGTDIVIQSHYVNSSPNDWNVRDTGWLLLAPEGSDPVEAGYIVVNNGVLDMPQGPSDWGASCALPEGQDYNLMLMLGHMHELGTSIRVDGDQGDGPETLYEVADWEVEFRDDPPIVRWSASEPYAMQPGDTLDLHCAFDNTKDHAVRFPEEMCVTVSVYWPAAAEPLILCDEDDGEDPEEGEDTESGE